MRRLYTARLANNEVAKAGDFQKVADQSFQSAASLVAALAGENATTPFVIRGLQVVQNSNMVLTVKAGIAVNAAGQLFVLHADTTVTISPNVSGQTRIDTIEISEALATTQTENRATKDAISGAVVVSPMDTEQYWTLSVVDKLGTPSGSPVAPAVTAGSIKIAEVTVASGAASILNASIAGVTMTNPLGTPSGYGSTNLGAGGTGTWSTAPASVYRLGDVTALKSILRALVDETGTPYPAIIHKAALDLGGGAAQIKAQDFPVGTELSYRGLTSNVSDYLMTELQSLVNLLTPVDDLKKLLSGVVGSGVYSGLGFSLAGGTQAQVSAGLGISPNGDLIRVSAGVSYTLSGFSRPTAGNSVWVMFCLQPNPAIAGATYAGDDWLTLVPVSGTPAASPSKPALSAANGLLVAEVIVDNATVWTSLTVDYNRVVLANGGTGGGDTLAAVKNWGRPGNGVFPTGSTNTPEGTATGAWFYSYEGNATNGVLAATKASAVWFNNLSGGTWQGWHQAAMTDSPTFNGTVTAPTFAGALNGNANSATNLTGSGTISATTTGGNGLTASTVLDGAITTAKLATANKHSVVTYNSNLITLSSMVIGEVRTVIFGSSAVCSTLTLPAGGTYSYVTISNSATVTTQSAIAGGSAANNGGSYFQWFVIMRLT